jgi:type IV pilus assembly protein PilB
MRVEPQQLKAFMMDAGLISSEKFDECLKKAKAKGVKVEDILISEGIISENDLRKLEAYILGVPFVDLEKEIVDPEVLKIIPEPVARTNNIVAFRKKGNNVEVAMLDPEDLRGNRVFKEGIPKFKIFAKINYSRIHKARFDTVSKNSGSGIWGNN